MEEMNHKSELAIIREQQLARLRESTGTPERFVVDFACARHDRAFRATFARFSPAQRFRRESRRQVRIGSGDDDRAAARAFAPGRSAPGPDRGRGFIECVLRLVRGGVRLDALPQLQNDDLRRSQLGPVIHLPRQLRREIPDGPARCA
jgi:hypothetical protein